MSTNHRLFFLIFLLGPLTACLTYSYSGETICLNPKHNYIENDFSNVLWTIPDLFVFSSGNGPMLTATLENAIIAGRTPTNSSKNLLSYDISSGNISWQKNINLPLLLASDQTTLFIGENDQIVLLDGKSGSVLDKIELPGTGIITSFYKLDDMIFVHGSAGRFETYDTVQKIRTTSEQDFITRPLLIENSILFVIDVNIFKAIETNTGSVLWQTQIDESIIDPVFSNNMILFRTGNPIYSGNIYALDKKTGNVVWKRETNALGNIAINNSRVFFIATDGYLSILDQLTGEEIRRIEFSGGPFIFPDPDRVIGGYFVAVDPKGKTIFTTFGDSCQLYAIEIVK